MDERSRIFLAAHPEKKEIFKLADLMQEAEYKFYFSFWDYPEAMLGDDEFTEEFEFMIEVQTGELIGSRAPITVFQGDDGLTLLDMRPVRGEKFPIDSAGELVLGLSAEQAEEIIEKFFKDA